MGAPSSLARSAPAPRRCDAELLHQPREVEVSALALDLAVTEPVDDGHAEIDALAETENRFDVARALGVVSELAAQTTEVAREGVVSDLGVGSPQRLRNLAIADHGTGPRGEGVQEDVLTRRKAYLAGPLTDAL